LGREDEGDTLLRNVCNHLQDHTVSQPRRLQSTCSLPCKPQTSDRVYKFAVKNLARKGNYVFKRNKQEHVNKMLLAPALHHRNSERIVLYRVFVKGDSRLASQEVPSLLLINQNFNYCVHRIALFVPVACQLNTGHTFKTYFSKIHFHISSSSRLHLGHSLDVFPFSFLVINSLSISHLPLTCYV
jgi:hypothetical protein